MGGNSPDPIYTPPTDPIEQAQCLKQPGQPVRLGSTTRWRRLYMGCYTIYQYLDINSTDGALPVCNVCCVCVCVCLHVRVVSVCVCDCLCVRVLRTSWPKNIDYF